jgi:hypothetical protein
MTTYYDEGQVRVTSEVVRVAGRAYPLRDIARIWHVRSGRRWGVLAGRGALLVSLAGPLVAAVAVLLVAVRLRAPLAVTVAAVGVSVLLGLAAAPVTDLLLDRIDRSYDQGSHHLEIWAQWRGRPVRLLRTGDASRFGRIYRALQRAVEQHTTDSARR